MIALMWLVSACLSVPAPSGSDGGARDGGSVDGHDRADAASTRTVTTLTRGGGDFLCVLRSDGRAYCAGSNDHGQLGAGSLDTFSSVPVPVAGGHHFTQLSAGVSHACGIDDAGALWCWGSDADGRLGNGAATLDQREPVSINDIATPVTAVAAGGDYTCAINQVGLFCWGANSLELGQLGDQGQNPSRDAPPAEPLLASASFTAVVAGNQHACVLTSSGDLTCWGDTTAGEIDGISHESSAVLTPTLVTGSIGAVALSDQATSVLASFGEVRTQGIDAAGQHGDGPDLEVPSFSSASLPSGPVDIAAAANHHCALVSSAPTAVYCWGDGSHGEVQLGANSAVVDTPVANPQGGPVEALGVTAAATCAAGGTNINCWGTLGGSLAGGWTWALPTMP